MRGKRPALTLAVVAFAAGAGDASADELDRPALPGRLSDEERITRWTTAVMRAPVRRHADQGSRSVARLRFHTEDGLPEVYVGLEQLLGADGRPWVRVRVPMRPNGTTGWVRRDALGGWHVNRDRLTIRRRALVAVLRHRGRVVWRSAIGVGAPGMATPRGRFYVRERISNRGGDPRYGPIAFGTSAYSRLSEWPGGGVIGIHGTNAPELLPGRVSHGCVRVPNRALRRLASRLRIGTPVHVTDR